MCGIIAGFGLNAGDVGAGLEAIGHRGRDDRRVLIRRGWTMGHNRLAIVERTDRTAQPWEDARFVVSFNGEFYNASQLADTEPQALALLARRVRRWDRFLEGQYAALVLDKATGVLTAARDWFGIIPLYFAKSGSRLVFASERRALEAALPEAVPREVPPGAFVRVEDGRLEILEREPYRAPLDAFSPLVFLGLFEESVRKRALHTDVGFSLALSGGLDSALVACALWRLGLSRLCRAYTVVLDEDSEDHRVSSRLASDLGLSHSVLRVTPEELAAARPALFEAMDGLPLNEVKWRGLVRSYLVAQRAPSSVILCGEGADELFGGYPYFEGLAGLDLVTKSLGAVRSMRAINLDRLDRGGMAHTREYRAPFLDYALVQYALGTVRQAGKHDLRDVCRLAGVPDYVLARGKYGREERVLNTTWNVVGRARG